MFQRLPLYTRLALILIVLTVLSGAAVALLAVWSSKAYHREVTQRLHRELAAYIVANQPEPLIDVDGRPNDAALESLAKHTMLINPAVEVYLLDSGGRILGNALPEGSVHLTRVALDPLRRQLDGSDRVVLGEDPRQPDQRKIFSVAPVADGDRALGYLYIILGGYEAESLARELQGSYIVRFSLGAVAAISLLTLGVALWFFRRLTRPLRRLARDASAFQDDGTTVEEAPVVAGDEVALLEHTFADLRARVREQFRQLQENDRLRRELVSNISHDLRTPLASMQGYIETLLLKFETLDAAQQKRYLTIAHRHSRRLGKLVAQLFELSKLDAGRVQPRPEPFPLVELLHDIVQEYQLPAQTRGVALTLDQPRQPLLVKADIALIERVIQNLLDNALAHTPRGGRVAISVRARGAQVEIAVADTGTGIAPEELALVFDRYYQARDSAGVRSSAGA
ncbi:MAG: HAMP domain-containing sensor histidine kinase, partial [Candidatus Competibacterales bacterium]|nr:HAMP domain-containing sensor histidine kinase [Candidatus Competibacterales bacterium]